MRRSTSPSREALLLIVLGCSLLLAIGDPARASSDWSAAQEAFAARDWERAVDALERVLERSPDLAHAHFLLGLSLSELGRRDDGLAAVRRAVELDGETPQYALHLAKLLLAGGRAGAAAETLGTISAPALEPPLDSVFVALLSRAAADSGEVEPARSRLRATIEELEDAEVTAPLWRALGRLETERPDRAHAAYRRAFALSGDPDDARRAMEIAASAAAGAAEAERVTWSKRAADAADLLLAKRDPGDAELPLLAGRLRLQADQPRLARPLLELAASRAPSSADPAHELARCARALGDDEAALAHLETALARASTPEQEQRGWSLRARILHQQGRLREAAEAYERADLEEEAEALARAADVEDQVEQDATRCRALRADLERALAEAQGVVGPRDFAELEARAARRLAEAGCEAVER